MAIQETTFGPKTYVALRKTISTDNVMDQTMYKEAGDKLGAYIGENNLQIAGPWTVMYFTWDMESKTTDMAIAFPVANLDSVTNDEFSIITVDESKASMDTMTGSYDKLGDMHMALMKYTEENGLVTQDVPVMALEEYTVGAMQDPNPENWKTDIYYFHN